MSRTNSKRVSELPAAGASAPRASRPAFSPKSPPAAADLPTAKPGRPSTYSAELAERVCGEVACGRSLKSISAESWAPDARTILRWVTRYPEFERLYVAARAASCDAIVESLIDLVDTEPQYLEETTKSGRVIKRVDPGHVQHVRVQADVKKWILSKLRPEKYADAVSLSGPGNTPLIPPRPPVNGAVLASAVASILQARMAMEPAGSPYRGATALPAPEEAPGLALASPAPQAPQAPL